MPRWLASPRHSQLRSASTWPRRRSSISKHTPWYTDLKLTLGSGRVYETWGLLSGSIYGALGRMWASRSLVAAPIAVGLAFICEPVIVRAGIWGGGGLFEHPWMWITEVLIGSAPSRSSSPGRRRARPRTPEQFQR
jgi:hypothetical protein